MKRNNPLAFLAFGAMIATLAACGGTAESANMTIAFDTIDIDSYSGIATAQNKVVNDSADWASLWSQHKMNYSPAPALPAIDFSQKTVLGVFMGSRPSGCFGIQIQRVYNSGGKVIAEYKEASPESNATCTMAITYPSHLVSIPRTTLPVEFVKI